MRSPRLANLERPDEHGRLFADKLDNGAQLVAGLVQQTSDAHIATLRVPVDDALALGHELMHVAVLCVRIGAVACRPVAQVEEDVELELGAVESALEIEALARQAAEYLIARLHLLDVAVEGVEAVAARFGQRGAQGLQRGEHGLESARRRRQLVHLLDELIDKRVELGHALRALRVADAVRRRGLELRVRLAHLGHLGAHRATLVAHKLEHGLDKGARATRVEALAFARPHRRVLHFGHAAARQRLQALVQSKDEQQMIKIG